MLIQKPKSFELLKRNYFWNSNGVEPLLQDDKTSMHDLSVLTGKNKKNEKCLAKPRLVRRLNHHKTAQTVTLNDSSSSNESKEDH